MRLLDPEDSTRPGAWLPVHDRVMGGVSTGMVVRGPGALRFEGNLSLDNGGGFASFRWVADLPDLSSYRGLRVKVRGDGKTYKVSLSCNGGPEGVRWRAQFATESCAWTSVDLPFDTFQPMSRGRSVPEAGSFDPARAGQLGILIGDAQAGPFALELSSIETW